MTFCLRFNQESKKYFTAEDKLFFLEEKNKKKVMYKIAH